MDLIALFDSDHVRRAAACACSKWRTAVRAICSASWNQVFKAYALSDKAAGSVKFIPVDRINTHHRGGAEPWNFCPGENLDRQAGYRGEVFSGFREQLRIPVEVCAGGDGGDGDHGAL